MLSVELSATINTILSILAGLFCLWFIVKLWADVLQNKDIGSVGFLMIFLTAFLFDLWDAVAYTGIAIWGDANIVLPLTQLKPGIHAFEIFAYLLLFLHFRK